MDGKLPAAAVVMQGALLALLALLYGGDLLRAQQAASADVTWLTALPSVALGVTGAAVLGVAAALLGWGLATRKGAAWRGYRLGPIAGVAVLFFDFAVLSSMRPGGSGEERALLAVAALAEGAAERATRDGVPTEPRLLAALVEDLGDVPFFVKGERVPRWRVDVRRGCEGPAADAAGQGPGTLLYCVAGDGARAWVTLVGLAPGEIFGPPRVVSTEPPWMQAVAPPPPEVAPEIDDDFAPELGEGPLGDVWQLPTPDAAADSGR
jgi:hypothetical protein